MQIQSAVSNLQQQESKSKRKLPEKEILLFRGSVRYPTVSQDTSENAPSQR